ncbi:hypothetical protein CR969_02300 [Candidatus Saccharibacteria bacterium]|nr:MAG: hypothetical protein CR969_02300 [Candidatus Saccharibacteria bacterium]
MIEINLLPDVKYELLRTRATRNYVTALSILVGVIGIVATLALGFIFGTQLAAEAWQDGQIKSKSQELLAIEDLNKSVTIQNQLNTINTQHETKKINSRLFEVLGAINPAKPNNVKISTVKVNPLENIITIEGSAQNGFIALEVFKKTISNTNVQVGEGEDKISQPLASDIQPESTSFGEDAKGRRVLRFTFSFTYPDELFAISEQSVTINTPTGRVDVTDSKLGVPESLFSKKAKDVDSVEGGQDAN